MTEPTSDLQYRVERPVTDPLELEADAPLTEDEAGYVEAARAASTYPASSSVSGASASSSSGSVTGRSTRHWRSLVGSVMIGRIGGARRDSGDHPVDRRRQLHPSSGSGTSSVYDFGDDWEHQVTVEATTAAHADSRYPRCISGEGCGVECGRERQPEPWPSGQTAGWTSPRPR